ncbi:MAG: energy-coupled thiamine transporter ThiT [Clostridiales bacterium]|nr:energy-coupled thiamine transporter ThiT [Clostridiales bacterium]
MEKKKMQPKNLRLAVGGVMVAAAIILSMIKVYELPYGGSITLCSMLPVMLIGYMYGIRFGMLCGLVDGVIQAIMGTATQAFAGQKWWGVLLILLLDYIVAFSVLGLGGLFSKKIKNPRLSFASGIVVAGLARLAAHFVSGVILFGQWAEWYFTQDGFPKFGGTILANFSGWKLSAIYSAIYNLSYMLPEIIISAVVGVILISVLNNVIEKYK